MTDADKMAELQAGLSAAYDYLLADTRAPGRHANAVHAAYHALAQGEAPPPSVPAGFKLVPVEPTEAMYEAGRPWGTFTKQAYRAMLAAAPGLEGKPDDLTDDEWLRYLQQRKDYERRPPYHLDGVAQAALKRALLDSCTVLPPAAPPPEQAQPAVPALTEAWCHPARQALEWAENALATKSRDVDDWADDMHLIAKMLRSSLTRKDSHD